MSYISRRKYGDDSFVDKTGKPRKSGRSGKPGKFGKISKLERPQRSEKAEKQRQRVRRETNDNVSNDLKRVSKNRNFDKYASSSTNEKFDERFHDRSESDDSIFSDEVESTTPSECAEENIPIRLVEREDIAVHTSLIKGAGKGVFSKRDIPPGTILPYFALVKKIQDVKDDEDDTYFMSVNYNTPNNKQKNLVAMISDGNPHLPCMKSLPRQFRGAPFVNEASETRPNCVFVNNLNITKEDIAKAYRNKRPLPLTFLVVPYLIEKGEELYTMYGSEYDRDYEVWQDRHGYTDAIVELSHEIVESGRETLHKLL